MCLCFFYFAEAQNFSCAPLVQGNSDSSRSKEITLLARIILADNPHLRNHIPVKRHSDNVFDNLELDPEIGEDHLSTNPGLVVPIPLELRGMARVGADLTTWYARQRRLVLRGWIVRCLG